MRYTFSFIIISLVISLLLSVPVFGVSEEGKAFIIKSAEHDIKYSQTLKDIINLKPVEFTEYKEDLDVFFEVIDKYCKEMILETKGQARDRRIRAFVYIISHAQKCVNDIFKVCNVKMPKTEDI